MLVDAIDGDADLETLVVALVCKYNVNVNFKIIIFIKGVLNRE